MGGLNVWIDGLVNGWIDDDGMDDGGGCWMDGCVDGWIAELPYL